MPEYLHPGVYVEETSFRATSIEGVPTSTAAFLGESARGPVRPVLVTSVNEYQRWFGGVRANQFLPDAVRGFFDNGGRRLYVCRIASVSATYAQVDVGPNITLRAAGPGAWGSRVFALIEDSSSQAIRGGVPVPAGFRLRLAYYSAEPLGDPLDWFNGTAGAPAPEVFEDFDDLVLDTASADGWSRRLENSSLITLQRAASEPIGVLPDRGLKRLSGGADGASSVTAADFEGVAAAPDDEARGLAALAFAPYREVSLVYAPAVPFNVAQLVVRHCETQRFRFAIVDAGPSPTLPSDFDPRVVFAESKFAAFYYPWIVVNDPSGTQPRKAVPPGGHVAGVYARTDRERGVHKPPANETVRGALGLVATVRDVEQATLNPRHINVLRDLPGRGIRVWGARTLSSDSVWKYISVRRLFIYVERSLYEGTQWVVFEPNSEATWARLIDTVRQFLRRCWRDGALAGAKEEEAFFIRCDRTTMTEDDVLNGRLICEIGIAPTRPAEFVILRIFQHTADGTS